MLQEIGLGDIQRMQKRTGPSGFDQRTSQGGPEQPIADNQQDTNETNCEFPARDQRAAVAESQLGGVIGYEEINP